MNYQRTAMNEELKARLKHVARLEAEDYGAAPEDHASHQAAEAIEQLERQLAERDAEIAKYRDAPVVAVKLTWGGLELKDVYSTLPKGTQLIVKPVENK